MYLLQNDESITPGVHTGLACMNILVTGYRPRWTVRAGIRQLLRVFRERGLTPEDFEGSRYMRLAHLQARRAQGELDHNLKQLTKDS